MTWVERYGPLIAKAAGQDVPLAMLLGHVKLESGGRPETRTHLDERGLFQIHPGTSKSMGFDHNRMFDPQYNIQAGVEMFRRMVDRLEKHFPSWFPRRRDEMFWRFVRFEFAIGSGAARQILRRFEAITGRPARSWDEFVSFVEARRDELLKLVKHDPVKWAHAVNRVFATGAQLVGGAVGAIAGGGLAVLIALGIGAVALLWIRSRAERAHLES